MSTKPPARKPAVWTGFLRRFTDERAFDVRQMENLQREVYRAWTKSTWSNPNAAAALADYILKHIEKHEGAVENVEKRSALLTAITRVLDMETAIFSSADIDWSTAHLSLKDQVNLRRFLRSQQHFLANENRVLNLLINDTAAAFAHIIEAMPKATGASSLTVPMVDMMSVPPGDVIERVMATFIDKDAAGAGLFTDLLSTLYGNCCRASGFEPEDDTKKKPTPASQAGLPNAELLQAYLGGTPFMALFQLPTRFELTSRFSHHHIVATTNAGKTNLLSGMIVKDFDDVAAGKASVIVLDSQGDLIKSIVRSADFAPGGRLHDRLVYIDATDIEYPLALNIFARSGNRAQTPLDKRTEHSDLLEMLLFLFGALKQEVTGRQETLMRAVTSLIQEIPDATLTTLNEIFEPHDRKKPTLGKFRQYMTKLDPMDQKFFQVDFDGSEFSQSRAQIRARIQSLVTDPIFRSMFNATTQKLSMAAEMDAGKIIIINAYEDLLKDGTQVFGRFFIALAAQAAGARARMLEEKRMPTYFYVDECYKFIKGDTNVEKIFDTGRKYKLGLVIAHQRLNQLSEALQSAASGAAIKMAHAPIYEDKRAIANQMRTTPEWIDSMPKHTFATYIAGMTQPVALKIPLSPLENAPRMSAAEFEQVQEVMRRKYARMPDHILPVATVQPQTHEALPTEPANNPPGPTLSPAEHQSATPPPGEPLPSDPGVTSKRKW